MLIKNATDIPSSEITDERLYLRRREFMQLGAGLVGAAAGGVLVACGSNAVEAAGRLTANVLPQTPLANISKRMVTTTEPVNKFEEITAYNNYYEFGTGKGDPAKYAGQLKTIPSRQLIVSDGEYVAIQDLELGTDDRILLEQTPFRLLLRKDVDLIRDARILDVQEADDLIIVTMQDKSPDAPGRIKLFMSRAPQLELKEWVTSDSQGKDTRVEVSNLVKSEEIDAGLFKVIAPSLRKPGQ